MGAKGSQLSSLIASAQPTQACTAGFDDAPQSVIDGRCVPTITFIKQYFPPLIPNVAEFQHASNSEHLRNAFAPFEHATEHPQLQAFSTTLVQELHVTETFRKTVIQRCLKHEWIWVCVWLRLFSTPVHPLWPNWCRHLPLYSDTGAEIGM
jgi:hypothetical protein